MPCSRSALPLVTVMGSQALLCRPSGQDLGEVEPKPQLSSVLFGFPHHCRSWRVKWFRAKLGTETGWSSTQVTEKVVCVL